MSDTRLHVSNLEHYWIFYGKDISSIRVPGMTVSC